MEPLIKMFLLYTTEKEAWHRSEQEGIRIGLSFHINGAGSRYVTSPVETKKGKFALNVEEFSLSDDELKSVVSSIKQKTIPIPK